MGTPLRIPWQLKPDNADLTTSVIKIDQLSFWCFSLHPQLGIISNWQARCLTLKTPFPLSALLRREVKAENSSYRVGLLLLLLFLLSKLPHQIVHKSKNLWSAVLRYPSNSSGFISYFRSNLLVLFTRLRTHSGVSCVHYTTELYLPPVATLSFTQLSSCP